MIGTTKLFQKNTTFIIFSSLNDSKAMIAVAPCHLLHFEASPEMEDHALHTNMRSEDSYVPEQYDVICQRGKDCQEHGKLRQQNDGIL